MNYMLMVYNDRDALDALSDQEFAKVCKVCGEWVEDLEKHGKHVFSAGLQSASTATALRKQGNGISVTDGPYTETKEFLGGFTIFDADSHAEAVQIASNLAEICAGNLEMRPLMNPFGDLSDPIDQKIARAIKASIPEPAQ